MGTVANKSKGNVPDLIEKSNSGELIKLIKEDASVGTQTNGDGTTAFSVAARDGDFARELLTNKKYAHYLDAKGLGATSGYYKAISYHTTITTLRNQILIQHPGLYKEVHPMGFVGRAALLWLKRT